MIKEWSRGRGYEKRVKKREKKMEERKGGRGEKGVRKEGR